MSIKVITFFFYVLQNWYSTKVTQPTPWINHNKTLGLLSVFFFKNLGLVGVFTLGVLPVCYWDLSPRWTLKCLAEPILSNYLTVCNVHPLCSKCTCSVCLKGQFVIGLYSLGLLWVNLLLGWVWSVLCWVQKGRFYKGMNLI